MTDKLRHAAQQALEALESRGAARELHHHVITALRTALAEPEPRNQCAETCERAKLCAICARGIDEAEPQEPYIADVVRIMREAGMTFHLGLPHEVVIEQMTRVVDLVYAEASIKAAVAFAAPHPAIPPGYKLVPVGALTRWRDAFAEELSAWDINPPIHHVQASHDEIEAVLKENS